MLGLEAWPRSRGQILLASALALASGCLASVLALVSIIWPQPRVERGQGRGLWVWACEVRGCFTIVLNYILLNNLGHLGWIQWNARSLSDLIQRIVLLCLGIIILFLRTIWASFSALASDLWPRPWPQDFWRSGLVNIPDKKQAVT